MRKPRKFNRHLASKIMAGDLRGCIKTRDGHPVRIIAWDARGDWPITGLIYMDDVDTEMSWQWTKQGVPFGYSQDNHLDFTLVIELKEMSRMARCHRAPKKKKK